MIMKKRLQHSGWMVLKIVNISLFVLLATCIAAPAAEKKKKPLAADLVEDGQKIDISSPRYNGLFKELRLRHDFDQEELLRDDLLRSAWMFSVGAMDAFFCDLYADLLASVLMSKDILAKKHLIIEIMAEIQGVLKGSA